MIPFRLCDRLPNANVTLLRHFLCVLTHIAANSSQNMMSASNLAVCVGPSLLWAPVTNCVNPALALSAEAAASKQVPALVTVLIDKCTVLFGSETVRLLLIQISLDKLTIERTIGQLVERARFARSSARYANQSAHYKQCTCESL